MMSSFPTGSSVLLQNLVKGAHLNGKKGIVKSRPDAASGRQEVYVFESQKSMAIKPGNLRYEPRELSSLSTPEMNGLLSLSSEGSGPTITDEDELRRLVAAEIATEDPMEIAALVAKANEPKDLPSSSSSGRRDADATNKAASPHGSNQLRQGAERMSQMSSDDIRRQAATMKAMGPAALRACTPQMAGMTDAQINMAIGQMEAVANNPGQLKMAADQMKNMSDGDLRRAVNQSGLASQPQRQTAAAAPSSGNPAAAPNAAVAPAAPAVASRSQFQQATRQMTSMSPDQLRDQARMLRSTPFDSLRATNPQMAGMSDAQIEMSIAQLEQMAENPDMVKMAADQMKNMTEEQYESMRGAMGGALGYGQAGGDATTGGDNAAMAGMSGLPTDPSKMMEALLSSPEQLNTVIKTMKQNPEMMKQMMASQMGGGGGDGNDGGDGASTSARQKQMEKAIDSFAEMDEKKLQRYLRVANGVQSVAKPMLTTFDRAKRALGVSTKTLLVLINLMFLASLVLLARWWKLRGGGGGVGVEMEDDITALIQEEPAPESIDASHEESEF